jgi:hypothetical protein
MKWASMYLVGYVIFVIGVGAALWKIGALQGKKESIEIDRT